MCESFFNDNLFLYNFIFPSLMESYSLYNFVKIAAEIQMHATSLVLGKHTNKKQYKLASKL